MHVPIITWEMKASIYTKKFSFLSWKVEKNITKTLVLFKHIGHSCMLSCTKFEHSKEAIFFKKMSTSLSTRKKISIWLLHWSYNLSSSDQWVLRGWRKLAKEIERRMEEHQFQTSFGIARLIWLKAELPFMHCQHS